MNELHLQYRRETGHQVKNNPVDLIQTSFIPEHYLIECSDIKEFIPCMYNPSIHLYDPDYVMWLESKIEMLQPNQP